MRHVHDVMGGSVRKGGSVSKERYQLLEVHRSIAAAGVRAPRRSWRRAISGSRRVGHALASVVVASVVASVAVAFVVATATTL